ncbi:hypothetical protein Bca4012_018394 [Brassica carinata]
MVLIRNPSMNPPYIFLLFREGTLRLKKTHRFIYLITTLRKWSLCCPSCSNRPPPLNLRLSPAWLYYSVHCRSSRDSRNIKKAVSLSESRFSSLEVF